MSFFDIRLSGGGNINRILALARSQAVVDAGVELALDEVANEAIDIIESEMNFAKGYAIGILENSLVIQTPEPLARVIGTDVAYAAFVEFGTGIRGEASSASTDPSRPDDYVYGSTIGMDPESFMLPAMPEIEQLLADRVKGHIELIWDELAIP